MRAIKSNCFISYKRLGIFAKLATSYKINAVNSGSESWTGIGVVAGGTVAVLILPGPHMKQGDAHWRITLLHILQ
jgi:hypothetical protein